MLYFNNASSRKPLHYYILNPIGAMQRKTLSVAWLWLNFTQRKREKPSSPIIICGSTSLGQRGEDFYSNLWMWYQSQFHSRRLCIQNHIYHLFQSIDNVFQYLYFYQYLLEAFHSEPNSLITKFSSTLSWRKALKYLLKTFIAITFVYQTVSSTIPLESPKLFCRCLRPQ